MNMSLKVFHKHSEIPLLLQEYILKVSEVRDLSELSLTEINDFLAGLEEYHGDNLEVYS